MRDDFPKPVLDILAKRVGYRCSNPECRKPTSGPHRDDNKTVNVGVGSHITAASAGGPRYDSLLTPDRRRSQENGIWLCQNCGKLVDNDEARYTSAVLREWRRIAEAAALTGVESSGFQSVGGPDHSIRFGVDDWTMWRERGNLPGDVVWVISQWGRGDVRFGCTVRLRNDLYDEDQLHRLRIEFRAGGRTLLVDTDAFNDGPTILPPRKWVSVEVGHGVRDWAVVEEADSAWLVSETVGDNCRLEWKLADLNVTVVALTEA
ncbi:hypothetical protein R5W24_003359 [Gemmata sp. JC717]|uniref:hypothetical protein n=1 Tax=Gemmata algarum TaxID=2975278 RepID=UPI0021BACEA2|nr:hypothetical protein [Gemmata algarum]MDY3554240.1 hypothetical protein [Gemmata algarum]